MTRLVLDQDLAPATSVRVAGDEAHYLLRVRRHVAEDRVELRGRDGRRFRARLTAVERSAATLLVEEELLAAPAARPVRLLVAVPKGQLLDEVVRRASELGVARLAPITCERSVVDPGPAKLERWRRIATAALRQCGRATPLIVDPVRPLAAALELSDDAPARIVLHPGEEGIPSLIELLQPRPAAVSIAIGPEGGFTAAELATAERLGYRPAHLGPLIMRIETAAVIAAGLSVAFAGGFD